MTYPSPVVAFTLGAVAALVLTGAAVAEPQPCPPCPPCAAPLPDDLSDSMLRALAAVESAERALDAIEAETGSAW